MYSFIAQPVDGGAQDSLHDLREKSIVYDRRGRVRSHSTRVRPGIAIEHSFVVLARYKRYDGLSVGYRQYGRFLPFKIFFDYYFLPRGSKLIFDKHIFRGTQRFFDSLGDNNAFARGQTVSFYHKRKLFRSYIVRGFIKIFKYTESRRGNIVPAHKFFREDLARFHPCRGI